MQKKASRSSGGKKGNDGAKGAKKGGAAVEAGDAAPGVRKLLSPSGWLVLAGRNSRCGAWAAAPASVQSTSRAVFFHTLLCVNPLRARSSRGNETVSHVLSRDTDVWFHLRGLPGSHVILRVPPGKARCKPHSKPA